MYTFKKLFSFYFHYTILLHSSPVVGSSFPRGHHGCAQYGDGKVLIAGEGTGKNETRYLLDSVEVNQCY